MTEFITRIYGQREFEVIIKTDNKDHYKATEDFARNLIDHARPQTNADRIRAMSDEELAIALMEQCMGREICARCPAQECSPKCPGESFGAWEEWLKQPAEVADNG